jgi:hypothetical protein
MMVSTNNFTFVKRLGLKEVTELEDLLHFTLILNINDFTPLRRLISEQVSQFCHQNKSLKLQICRPYIYQRITPHIR